MNRLFFVRTILLVIAVSVHSGCDKGSVGNQGPGKLKETTTVPKKDIEGLGRLINFPYAPRSVTWTTEKFGQGDNWGLSALLTLDRLHIQGLLKSEETLPNCQPKIAREILTWFPAAVQAEVMALPGSQGDRLAVDAICLRPTAFTTPEKSPAIHGNALVFERHNLVFLDLYTM
jgi:hypothetical protein